MSSHLANVQIGTSPPVEVPSDIGIPETQTSINNYRVARSLLQSILLPADIEAFSVEGGAFRVQDSYNFVLWISGNLSVLLGHFQFHYLLLIFSFPFFSSPSFFFFFF